MGFTKEQVVQKTRAAFNNSNRALGYLMIRMPLGMEQANPPRAKPIKEVANPLINVKTQMQQTGPNA